MDLSIHHSDEFGPPPSGDNYQYLDKHEQNIIKNISLLIENETNSTTFTSSIFNDLLSNIKSLRNACSKGNNYQWYIALLPNLYTSILPLAFVDEHHKIFSKLNPKQIDEIKILSWQLMANLTVNCSVSKKLIWLKCSDKIINSLLSDDISSCTDIQLMILNNLTKTEGNPPLQPYVVFGLIVNIWSKLLEQKEDTNLKLEFLDILFEDFLCSNSIEIADYFSMLEQGKQIDALKYISFYIHNNNPNGKINGNLFKFLSKEFQLKTDSILNTANRILKEVPPKYVIALLDVIAKSSGDDNYAHIYSNDHSLFLNVGAFLQLLNVVGKDSLNNIYTPMEKLNEVAPTSNINKDFQNEISYQLRTQLVRTLANLLYKNRKNQEYAKEMKIILAILDCTRIDARNPMIKEWSILAIRNFCEGSQENQELIRKLTKLSDAPNDILSELNLEMGSLRIKPNV